MNEEERKTAERQLQRTKYFEYLDMRIPQLHAMGKPPKDPNAKPDDPLKIEANLRASKFPGVMARHQADAEWGEMQAA